ncbi:MAG: CDP-diacylglycerol--serine O-phosphatidyltransferase [Candidatus Pelagibacter sp.]|nr:CDP-diacylglycerol--serine O-phosphatidyltransferase [Candidatus Pelagibacter sp.]OUW24147.1 MAG: CDP-diacylglycerol--serine O-phosphatidyltransferase [Rickettsiales bacterium TMED174]|tara:strand:+ start:146 stop:931 length:786 start_codon:yes stop_codon:yes gene_type:complete
MEKKKFKIVPSKKTRYILPNLLTIAGVCLGISSIKFSLDLNFKLAVVFILLASILDALDGRIARLIKATTDFGKELDSLTDFVSFGIAPAFIIYFWTLNQYGKIGWAITLIFSVCCVLRLARFNLTKYNSSQEWKQNYFEGIPSPIGAILILMPLINELSEFSNFIDLKIITPGLTIFVSLLLISKIPTYSLKKIKIKPSLTIFILLAAGISLVSLMFFTFETLVIFGLTYMLSVPISSYTFFSKKRNKQDEIEDEHEDIL